MNRNDFLKGMAAAGLGMALPGRAMARRTPSTRNEPSRVGVIGLDTSHAPAFTRLINNTEGARFRVTTAYPYGSRTIESSYSRIPQYIDDMKQMGVEIVDSIDALLQQVEVVLLLTNDGNPRLEQALQVMEAGKLMYVDKPVAASLRDTIAMMRASERYGLPFFSSSGLRYVENIQSVRHQNAAGTVLGADAFGPAFREPSHPDLFWYGIHGVEILFTVLGTGCQQVQRFETPNADIVTGLWEQDRTGVMRGIIEGRTGYGGMAYGTEAIVPLGPFAGYGMLAEYILEFFETGRSPIHVGETLEIYAFMEAADESKRRGGQPVSIQEVIAMNQ